MVTLVPDSHSQASKGTNHANAKYGFKSHCLISLDGKNNFWPRGGTADAHDSKAWLHYGIIDAFLKFLQQNYSDLAKIGCKPPGQSDFP